MTIKLANTIITGSDARPTPVHEVSPAAIESLGTSLRDVVGDDVSGLSSMVDTEAVRNTISVSVDLLQRLYSGMYILNQTVMSSNFGPETPAILEQVLRTKLIEPLTRTFPDMAEFEFSVKMNEHNNIIVEGGNTFSSTLLNAIHQSLHAPVAEVEADESSYDDDDDSFPM